MKKFLTVLLLAAFAFSTCTVFALTEASVRSL